MIEKLLESWLDNASERQFQLPFCLMLSASGHRVVHMTRHCGMEFGKDVISITPTGRVCAFQLKRVEKRLTQASWHGMLPQIIQLLNYAVSHPSLPNGGTSDHDSTIVINGDLSEEVIREIQDLNQSNVAAGFPGRQLCVMVRADLLAMARRHSHVFWPHDFAHLRPFLRIIAQEPRSPADIESLCGFFQSLLPDPFPSRRAALQTTVAGFLSIVAFISSNHVAEDNYDAEVTVLVHGLCYMLGAIERASADWRAFDHLISLVVDRIYHSIGLLIEEAIERGSLVEGDHITDKLVMDLRVTRLCGLAAALYLRSIDQPEESDQVASVRTFITKHLKDMRIWGEGAIPLFIAVFFALRSRDATVAPNLLLFLLVDAICTGNDPEQDDTFLASPYYDGTYVVLRANGLDEEPTSVDFSSSSYCLESIVYMVARRLWKQELWKRWQAVSHIAFLQFKPRHPWMYYLWRCSEGDNLWQLPGVPEKWSNLLEKAQRRADDDLPDYLRHDASFLILFLIMYPHRFNPATAALLDSMVRTDCAC